MKLRNLLIAVLGAAVTAGGAVGAASAATPWQVEHPRRVEVNHRLTNLNRTIRHDRRDGAITPAEAHRLHVRTHRVRVEERRFARHDAGHITRNEQHRLNHQETVVRHTLPR
jgi:hypothetical protein